MDGGWIGKFLDSFFGDGEVEMRLRKMWPIFEQKKSRKNSKY
jgi:hypothetical protein